MCLWHKWVNTPVIRTSLYLGSVIIEPVEGDLRYCSKCGKVQQNHDYGEFGTAYECRSEVAMEMISLRQKEYSHFIEEKQCKKSSS
jgi:hypothetical protein